MAGFFLTLEGGEGAGKSTQARRLAALLRESGHTVVQTREPGGTPEAEALRNILVTGSTSAWSSTAEALLNYAARDGHLRQLIRPALQAGSVVICDRFMDSTRAYQGHAGDCPLPLIDALEKSVVGATRPDLTLLFDISPATGLARARARGEGDDRFERKGQAYHERLRAAFLEMAKGEPDRFALIDANRDEDAVFSQVVATVMGKLNGR